jgi:hypothetical protein
MQVNSHLGIQQLDHLRHHKRTIAVINCITEIVRKNIKTGASTEHSGAHDNTMKADRAHNKD